MRLRSKAPLLIAGAVIAFLFAAKALFHKFGPELLLNFTYSVPIGVYRLSPLAKLEKRQYVAFELPAHARKVIESRPWYRKDHLFLKQVAGLAGDEVCTEKGELRINGIPLGPVFRTDRQGIPLPHFEGCYRINEGEVFVLGPDSEWSFDSRYFGGMRRSEIKARAAFIW